jgi:hypothetical protein
VTLFTPVTMAKSFMRPLLGALENVDGEGAREKLGPTSVVTSETRRRVSTGVTAGSDEWSGARAG